MCICIHILHTHGQQCEPLRVERHTWYCRLRRRIASRYCALLKHLRLAVAPPTESNDSSGKHASPRRMWTAIHDCRIFALKKKLLFIDTSGKHASPGGLGARLSHFRASKKTHWGSILGPKGLICVLRTNGRKTEPINRESSGKHASRRRMGTAIHNFRNFAGK